MRDKPPTPLVELLERLDLASPAQLRAACGRARRLAGDLPLFESVWVDALAQSRAITAYQASELNAGRGEKLVVGPFVLLEPYLRTGCAVSFRARERGGSRVCRLLLPQRLDNLPPDVERRLARAVEQSRTLSHESVAPLESSGHSEDLVWAACPMHEGTSALEWMSQNGRFPPAAALEIARQMTAALATLEQHEIVHGDVGTQDLTLNSAGLVVLAAPGLRAALRPAEGFGHADLPPESYAFLPPERISQAAPPTTAGDLYGAGYVWWNLLAGRQPFAGGSSLIRLEAALRGITENVREVAPDAPEVLLSAIEKCTHVDPARRPISFAEVAKRLGTSSSEGRRALMLNVAQRAGTIRRRKPTAGIRRRAIPRLRLTTAAVLLAAVTLGLVAAWKQADRGIYVFGDRGQPAGRPPASEPMPGENTDGLGESPQTRAPRRSSHLTGGSNSAETAPAVYLSQQSTKSIRQARAIEPIRSLPGEFDQVRTAVGDDGPTSPPLRRDDEIILPNDRLVLADELELRPGVLVRAENNGRARVLVPSEGLLVDVEQVLFERIDFVRHRGEGLQSEQVNQGSSRAAPVFVRLAAYRASFDACTFVGTKNRDAIPAAITWDAPRPMDEAVTLPTGVLVIKRCAFQGVRAGIECHSAAALVIQTDDVLFLGPGPFMQLSSAPRIDEPIVLSLRHTTLRGANAIIECQHAEAEEDPGELSIRAWNSVFAPSAKGALIVLRGETTPRALVAAMHWSGQGALVTPETPIIRWYDASGRSESLPEDRLRVAGLVKSEVEFAGGAEEGVAASEAERWQVPLRSTDPPGVGRLPFELSRTDR